MQGFMAAVQLLAAVTAMAAQLSHAQARPAAKPGEAVRPHIVGNVLDSGAHCDGEADDTQVIQAEVDTAAGHAELYVPALRTCMVRGIQVPSDSFITVDGTLKLMPGANAAVLSVVTGGRNVHFGGKGTIDGNRAAQTAGEIAGIATRNGQDISVVNLSIRHVRNWPVNIVATKDCSLDSLTIEDGGNSPEFAAGSSNCWARHLRISNIHDEAFAFYGGVANSGISDSVLKSGTASGISVLSDRAQPAANHDIIIKDNAVTGMAIAGVEVAVGQDGGPSHDVRISHNRLIGNGRGNNGFGGVRIVDASRVDIADNFIADDGGGRNEAAGIYLVRANQVTITGNVIMNEGRGGTLGTGIHVAASGSDIRIENNTIVADKFAGTMAFGIVGSMAPGVHPRNNTIQGMRGAAYPRNQDARPVP